MIGTLSFFIFSCVGIITLIITHRLFTGSHEFYKRSDELIKEWLNELRHFVLMFNKKTFLLLFHFLIEKIEKLFIKFFRKLKALIRRPLVSKLKQEKEQ
jgi:hypothetical protein